MEGTTPLAGSGRRAWTVPAGGVDRAGRTSYGAPRVEAFRARGTDGVARSLDDPFPGGTASPREVEAVPVRIVLRAERLLAPGATRSRSSPRRTACHAPGDSPQR